MLYVNPLATTYALQADLALDESARERVALKELEQYFVFTLLQEMRKSIPKNGLFDGGFEARIRDQMMDDALSAAVAESGQLGIARMVEEQLRIADLQQQIRAPEPAGPSPATDLPPPV